MSKPNSRRTRIIGVSHHFLLCISMEANSLKKPACFEVLVMSEKSVELFSFFIWRILELLDVTTIGFGLFDIFPVARLRKSSALQFWFPKEANQKGIGAKNYIVEERQGGPNN